jgi:hypothetical protein
MATMTCSIPVCCMPSLLCHDTVQGLSSRRDYTIAIVAVAAGSALPRSLLARTWLAAGAHAAARQRGKVSQTVTLQLKSHLVGKGQLTMLAVTKPDQKRRALTEHQTLPRRYTARPASWLPEPLLLPKL